MAERYEAIVIGAGQAGPPLAERLGISIQGPVRVDVERVEARKDEVAGASHAGVCAWIEGMQNVSLVRGHARFTGPHSIEVGPGRSLHGERFFLDVGARAYVPELPGLESVPYLTNSSMMELDSLPDHLLVVGGGYIGLEFAQMYRRFGSREEDDRPIDGSHLLLAVGRRPNTGDLGLEAAGVATDGRWRIPVADELRTEGR